jgi:multimeric flavodoxin WrbA
MKILVLNGSPKGDKNSVTMKYVNYLELKFSEHTFDYIKISQKFTKMKISDAQFEAIMDQVQSADFILWAFPVYVMLVPAQIKMFIEYVIAKDRIQAFEGKYTAVLMTSIHFYDHTAYNYIHGVCDDFGMKMLGFQSNVLNEIMDSEHRQKIRQFFETALKNAEDQKPVVRKYQPITPIDFRYIPELTTPKEKIQTDLKAVIITDASDPKSNLSVMIQKFNTSFSEPIEVVNLHDLLIKGGCIGCLACTHNNECFYDSIDEYSQFYVEKIRHSDVIMFAGTMTDRYLSSRWKLFFDRSFYRGHTPTWDNKQIGFLISGALSQNANLHQILVAYSQIQNANVCGIITDEISNSETIDHQIEYLAKELIENVQSNVTSPKSFLKIGGIKIFRDEVYAYMRRVCQADHKYYIKHGWYDFPTKNWGNRILNAGIDFLYKFKWFWPEVKKRIFPSMMEPFNKMLHEVEQNKIE